MYSAALFCRILRRSLSAAAALLLASTTTVAYGDIAGDAMQAMNRERFSPTEFHKQLRERVAATTYVPRTDSAPVALKFNIATAAMADTVLVIESSRVGQVYVGPYRDAVVIMAGKELTNDHGLDGVKIALLRVKTHEIYVFEQEARLWQPNRTVRVEFLRERRIDQATGTPIAFKVYVQ